MKTSIQRAFFEGVANPTLLIAWKEATRLFPERALMVRRWGFITLLLMIIASLSVSDESQQNGLWWVTALSCATLICLYMLTLEAADCRFARDCYKLNDLLRYAGCTETTFIDMTEAAKKRLVQLAVASVRARQCTPNELARVQAKSFEKDFRVAHRLFQKFDLVEEKWDTYWAAAKEIVQEKFAA